MDDISSSIREAMSKFHLQRNIQLQEQDVLNVSTADGPGETPVHLHESIQSEKVMATRFHEDLTQASIQTGTEIQEKSEAKVGKTEMDEGC
jgi:hypothetical protein